jgi:hypothetical protein
MPRNGGACISACYHVPGNDPSVDDQAMGGDGLRDFRPKGPEEAACQNAAGNLTRQVDENAVIGARRDGRPDVRAGLTLSPVRSP